MVVCFLLSIECGWEFTIRLEAVRLCLRLGRVQLELHENDRILYDRSEGPQQPWQCLHEVGSVLGVREEAGAVSQIACQRQEEEQQSKTWAKLNVST